MHYEYTLVYPATNTHKRKKICHRSAIRPYPARLREMLPSKHRTFWQQAIYCLRPLTNTSLILFAHLGRYPRRLPYSRQYVVSFRCDHQLTLFADPLTTNLCSETIVANCPNMPPSSLIVLSIASIASPL